MEPIFSIIVPVYNTEEFLCKAVNSVLAQDFDAFELILVDDGSQDTSPSICDEYATSDSRVTVIHQENHGLSAARNAGLQIAVGEYIVFLDSDDFFTEDSHLGSIIEIVSEFVPDMICVNYARYLSGRMKKAEMNPEIESGIIPAEKMVANNTYQSSACCKIVRRSIIDRFGLCFPEGLLSEDIKWSAELLSVSDRIYFYNRIFFAYRINEKSITHNIGIDSVHSLITILEDLAEKIPENEKKKSYLGFLAFQYCTLLINWRLAGSPNCKNEVKIIKKLSNLLSHGEYYVIRMVRVSYKAFGMKITSRLLECYYKIFRSGSSRNMCL